MQRFEQLKSLAGVLQPGDSTRYEMVVVERFGSIEVVVLNDDFFDRIIFLPNGEDKPYHTLRGSKTNPWTIKAAEEMKDMLLKGEF
jgi:hypothetical protein